MSGNSSGCRQIFRWFTTASLRRQTLHDAADEARAGGRVGIITNLPIADPAQAAAIRDLVVHWYRSHLWKNNNKDTWIAEYLVKDQRLDEEDAKIVAAADGSATRIPAWDEVRATQQDTIDLLQAAGQFKGKELKVEDELDTRFEGLSDRSPAANDEKAAAVVQ